MAQSERWGELRSLLESDPASKNKEDFQQLIDLINALPDVSEREAAAHHARDRIRRWPRESCAWSDTDAARRSLPPWAAPLIRTLELSWQRHPPDATDVRTLCALPALEIEALNFELFGEERLTLWRELLGMPCMRTLQALHLKENTYGERLGEALAALADTPLIHELNRLTLAGDVDQHASEANTLLRRAMSLTHLTLDVSLISSATTRLFRGVTSPLTHLDLSRTGIDTRGVKQLVASPCLDELEVLDLSHCGLGARGLATLCTMNNSVLRVLKLERNDIGESGVKALDEALFLGSLRELTLTDNSLRLASRSLESLSDSGLMQRLEVFELARCFHLTGRMLAPMFKKPLTEMRTLDLSDNRIGTPGVALLVEGAMPKLERLKLRRCELDGASLAWLERGEWPALRQLDVRENEACREGELARLREVWGEEVEVLG